MRLKLRLERWGRSLVGQFSGDFPDELRGEVNFKKKTIWNVISRECPEFYEQNKTIFLPGSFASADNCVCLAKFTTNKEAAEAKEEIISALRKWEQSLHEDFEEENNVYVFEI